jgi:hypothetical protein
LPVVAGLVGRFFCIVATLQLLMACAQERLLEPSLEDPQDIVTRFEVAPLEDFGIPASEAGIEGKASVIRSGRTSRAILIGYTSVPCPQSPAVVVRQTANVIRADVTPRQADPDLDCDAMSVPWGVLLRLTEALGDRTVTVSVAQTGATEP